MTDASTRIGFEFKSGDLQARALYAEPTFALFQDFPRLARGLYAALSGSGVILSDIRMEGASGSLADFHLAVSLLRFSTVIRVRLDHLELHCFDVRNLREQEMGEAFRRTLQVLAEHNASPIVSSYSFAIGLHGALVATAASSFINRFVSARGVSLGPAAGVGAVMYFGPAAGRSSASITLDLSGVVENGLFLKANAMWDASSAESLVFQATARAFVDEVTAKLGLELR